MVQNKTILVTGGASGVGRATAVLLASEGAHVVIADLADDGGAETLKMIISAGGSAEAHQLDASDYDQMSDLVTMIKKLHGSLDGAFNNAGVAGPVASISKHSMDDWDNVIRVNLTGVFAGIKCEISQMLSQETGGSIVNTASIYGLVGIGGQSAYNASKHGVVGITRTVALEYAKKNIRCNAVCPGFTETPMLRTRTDADPSLSEYLDNQVPMRRKGQASEIAEAVMWLLSDRSSYVTGIALPVDGGCTAA
jgi:NAD(P)-dependent dehydrogenase (short-subunit alcohol dehydrogenase family)